MDESKSERGETDRAPSSEPTARTLAAMGPVLRLGFLAVGVASALQFLSGALERPQASGPGVIAAVSAAFASLVFYGLIGWFAGRVLPAIAEFLEQQNLRAVSAARTTSLLEDRLIAAVENLAGVVATRADSGTEVHRDSAQSATEIRAAIRSGNWGVAGDLIRALDDRAPGNEEASRLARELDDSKQLTAQSLLAKVDAAREANDPERVLEHRDALVPLMEGNRLRQIDRDLAKWFMGLIHKRLRAGTVRPDVANLAGRVARSLDDTPEGASLRAALPTLRRSAGLCARCAQPYTGIADACPNCLGTASFPAYQPDAEGNHPDAES